MTSSITVITVTLNCVDVLPRLIHSLKLQTDCDFQWLVKDGGSIDGTLDLLHNSDLKNTKIICQPDYGIYDALNQAILACDSDYYLVAGADDTFFPDAVSKYKSSLKINPSSKIIASNVITTNGMLRPKHKNTWKYGGNTYVASHAVGTMIKTDLHQEFGFYSWRYPNCADMHFVLRVADQYSNKISYADFTAGSFCLDGISSADRLTSITDVFRMQIERGESLIIQVSLLIYRLIKGIRLLYRS